MSTETITGASKTPAARSRPRVPHWLVRGFGTLLLLLVAAFLVATQGCTGWMATAIISGPNTYRPVDPAEDATPRELADLGVARQLRVDVGPPVASIAVWLVDTAGPAPARGTIFVIHGITDNKRSMLGVGKMLASHGYRAVLVDARAHGRSSGKWITFGAFESRDLSQVLDALEAQHLVAGPVGLFGHSYGASIGIEFAGVDPRVKAVVAISPFSSLRDVVPDFVHHEVPVIGWLVSTKTVEQEITRAGTIAGFNPDDASPLRAASKTRARLLLIASRADERISYQQAERIHEAAVDHSELRLVDHVSHLGIMHDQSGTLVQSEAVAWFDQWLEK